MFYFAKARSSTYMVVLFLYYYLNGWWPCLMLATCLIVNLWCHVFSMQVSGRITRSSGSTFICCPSLPSTYANDTRYDVWLIAILRGWIQILFNLSVLYLVAIFYWMNGSRFFLEKEAYPRPLHPKDACGHIIKQVQQNTKSGIRSTARKGTGNKHK